MSDHQPQLYFTLEKFSHHFVVKKMSPMGQAAAEAFARKFIQFKWRTYRGISFKEADRVYAARVAPENELRFHTGQWAAFIQFLNDRGISPKCYEVLEYGFEPPADLGAKLVSGWVARDYQIPIIEYLKNPQPTTRKLVEIQPGKGKFLSLDSLIKVPRGWKRMGDIKVGDVVTAWDGTPSTVTGVFPQGKKQLYKVTFADGRSVEAGAEHLWKFHYKNTTKKRRWRVGTTMDMLRHLSLSNPDIHIPLCDSEECDEVDLPIPPYLLGVILGDGCTSGGQVAITKLDSELFKNCEVDLGDDLEFRTANHRTKYVRCKNGISENWLATALTEVGLMGKRSWEKFIPKEYLHAATNQRLALLQGLMDTDGTVNSIATGGAISYNSTSKQLAEDVQYLVRSLGGIASISVRNTKFTHKGELREGRESYDVNIRYKKPSDLFSIPRKKERTNDNNQYAKGLKLRVVSIEPSRVTEAQCISIDHPDRLYITDDFIVTHNTFCAAAAASSLGSRIVMFLKPKYLEKWERDLKALLGIEPEEIEMVKGSKSLMHVIAKAAAGDLDCKAIIVSNRTFQNYITLYEKQGKKILDQGYDCLPQEFIQMTGCGVRIIDEVHEDFHLNFKIDLYTHVEWAISLSATLVSDDPFITEMHEIAYAPEIRYNGLDYDKYVDSYAFLYRIANPERIRTTELGNSSYSHTAFEKSIARNPKLLEDYLDMIAERVELRYLTRMKSGQRCLLYAASIQMCTIITDYLKKLYPDLDVRRYVENDPYDNLMEADLCVSTIGSAGTGHDIPNLITVILTVAIASKASNIQGFGRLRKLNGVDVEFEYFTCLDIPKHMEYHERKELLISGLAKRMFKESKPLAIGM